MAFMAVLCAMPPVGASAQSSPDDPPGEIVVGRSVKNDVSPPLREIPVPPPMLQEQHVKTEPLGMPRLIRSGADPVVQDSLAPAAMPAPILNFDGILFPGVSCNCAPPDTNGEVGATQYVQMVNEGLQVFNKVTSASVLGPIGITTLWAGFGGVCENNGSGDPVVVYDQLANRWVVSQFAGVSIPTDECVAVSTSSDATGTWNRYAFHLGSNFFDYPKLGVWPDAYYLSMNVFNSSATAFLGPQPFALDRAAMLAGTPATFVTPGLQPIALGSLIPGDLDGAILPAAGAPNPWLSTDPLPWQLFRFHADFVTPANSTFTLGGNLAPAAFTTLAANVPQLGTASLLDSLADRPMFRLAYRRFADGHEALVGNLTVSSGGVAGIRFWEINNATSGAPAFAQQGTYQPDSTWRWMGSAAMDTMGNLVVGFSASSSAINPQIRYAGRLAGDAAGQLAQGEATLHAGTGSQVGTSSRWGDYSDLTVDPVDDCTFWYTTEYYSTTASFNWRTRIGNFKFPSCSLTPTFTLGVTPASQDICAPANADYTVNIGSVSGFVNPVTLSATGNPAGTTVGFLTNPVTPPGSTTMTIGNTGAAAPGPYTVNVQGQSPDPITLNQNVGLNVFTAAPGVPTLLTPADNAVNQPVQPSFSWSAVSDAATYTIEIATDAGFTSIVHTGSNVAGTTYSAATLNSNTLYFWRVRANNPCGSGTNSGTFSFTTLPLPGDCPIGQAPVVGYTEGFEGGAAGWTHSAAVGADSWAISGAVPNSGTSSFLVQGPTTVSDQRLLSPALSIPAAAGPPITLQYFNRQSIEDQASGTACFDGAILEVSTSGSGGPFTQVTTGLQTDPYTGPVSSAFASPIAGLNAWCRDPVTPSYLKSIVDISSFAGQTVHFRFRFASDNSVSRTNAWSIDDVLIQACGTFPVELQDFTID